MKIVDYSSIEAIDRYKLMSNCVVPRPIAWISTEREGIINLAPFSYFTPLSSNPPILIVSIGHKSDGTPKDTLNNIRRSGICTINMTPPKLLEPMHFSSKSLDKGVSEAELFNIETQKIVDEFPPIIKGVPTAFFCSLYEELEIEGSKTIPIILKVEKQYISRDIIVDEDRLKLSCETIGRVGASYMMPSPLIDAPEIPNE